MTVTEEITDVRGAAALEDEELSGSGPWEVHGVAIGPEEVTVGMSGQKKIWPSEALKQAAETLSGKNLVKNHVNDDVDAVVGAITEARFHPEYGVLFKGEVDDESLAEKISRERLDVSPRIVHPHVDDLEENENGSLVVDTIKEFANLAIVPRGAADSNRIQIGESGMLSRAELQSQFGDLADDSDVHDEEVDVEERVPDEETVSDLRDWDAEDLQDISVHEPSYSGTTSEEWNKPSLEDFDTDDLGDVDSHYVVSGSGFPPEDFGDLALPVVEPSGELNVNAVDSAQQLAGQVDGLSGDALDRVESILNGLDSSDDEDDEEEAQSGENPGEESTAALRQVDVLGVPDDTNADLTELEVLHY